MSCLAFHPIIERALVTPVPARDSSNVANMAQGACLLHIAITELVNSKFPQLVRTLGNAKDLDPNFIRNHPSQSNGCWLTFSKRQ